MSQITKETKKASERNALLIAFIGDNCEADKHGGGYIWGKSDDGLQMIAEVRGWGAIQNLYKNEDGSVEFDKAEKFQDALAEFIAEAVSEKIEREKSN